MAFQLSYSDERGITSPTSYWKLTNVSIDTMAKQATITFNGFASSEAREQHKAPVGQYMCYICNTLAEVQLDGTEIPANPRFDRFFGTSVMDEAGSNVVKQGYLAVLDIPGNPFEGAVEV